jgi:hypothetical protein
MNPPPRRSGHGAVLTVLVLLVGASSGCDGTGPASSSDGVQQRDADRSQTTEAVEEDPAPTGPRPCPSQSGRALTIRDRTTEEVAWGSLGDLVVGPRGAATLAWESGSRSSRGWQVRTSSLPSSPGDPQVLPGPPPDVLPAGARVSALFGFGDHLGVDGSGALTAAFRQDLRLASGQTTENYDLVLSDRAPGGAWSPVPHVVVEGGLMNTVLAVSSSGAAVLAWDRYDAGDFSSYVSYRPSAGAAWTPAEHMAPLSGLLDAGIDEAGRAVLLFRTQSEKTVVVRGTPTAGWSRPHLLPGRARTLAVGAGGAAVVEGTRGAEGRRPFTVSMSPSGTWREPVRQPGNGLYPDRPVAIDGTGHALYVWWEEERLMTRRSGAGGRWRSPCVLAEDAREPRYFDEVDSHVAVSSRGDALVMWRTKDPTPRLWARYKPSGQPWTEPIAVTPNDGRLLGEFRAAIGARGHAAMAWITGNSRQIHLLRASPPR